MNNTSDTQHRTDPRHIFRHARTCCNSTSKREIVSPLQRYEQKRCPPANELRVSDIYSHAVAAAGASVRLCRPSSIACWCSHGYIFPAADCEPMKYCANTRLYGIARMLSCPSAPPRSSARALAQLQHEDVRARTVFPGLAERAAVGLVDPEIVYALGEVAVVQPFP